MELPKSGDGVFLNISGLTKRYDKTDVVSDFNLSVRKGEFISLLGPSGCGKTTTLGMIAGFVEPAAGTITLDGIDITRMPPRQRGLGVVFQNYALFPHMSAAQNVEFGLEMRKIPKAERALRVAQILELVGLSAVANKVPQAMSGGQQQRVALARALVVQPSILLLDEPLSNLDAKRRDEMQLELRRIQRTLGTTTIMVTHDQSEAMALSDRIAVMRDGRIEHLGEPRDAYDAPRTDYVAQFLGRASLLPTTTAANSRAVVRPERIALVEPHTGNLNGVVETVVFQGSWWLCEVRTLHGLVAVQCANDGREIIPVGVEVGLAWREADMHHLVAPQ